MIGSGQRSWRSQAHGGGAHRHPNGQPVAVLRSRTIAAAVEADENCLATGPDGIWSFSAGCEPGAALMTVARAAWLTTGVVDESSIGSATQGCAPWMRLALFLIHAEATGDAQWGTYLRDAESAPFKPAILWSEEDLALLEGTQVYSTAMQYRQYFESQHAGLETVLDALGKDMQTACTLPRLELAAATVRARLLPIFPMDSPCLIPGTERVVHSRRPTASMRVKEEGLFNKTQLLRVEATSEAAAGAQLSLDFAPGKLESQVALDYGMYDVHAPQPGYLLTLSLPGEDEDSCYFDKLDIVEEAGMAPAQPFTLKPRAAPPPELLAFLRLMNVRGSDAFLLESIFRNEAWGHMMEPVSEENEAAVCDSMVAGCEAALAAFPTTLAEDIRALDELADDTSARAVALRVRSDEKEMLQATAEWFRQRAQSLEGMEYYQERRLKRLGLLDDDGNNTFEDMVQINI
eukprot:jgi/Ulvmu1/12065/UM083_0078.1